MNYCMNSHKVEAHEIVKLQPLFGRGGNTVLAPDHGLDLLLDDERHVKWSAGVDAVPRVGDWFVSDSALRTSFICPVEKFSELFSKVSIEAATKKSQD